MESKIIAANWKMNKTNAEARDFLESYANLITNNLHKVIFCVPFTAFGTVSKYSKKLKFLLGAQNLHPAKSGTHTGEVSSDMLLDMGVEAVIVGHSERRDQFKESDEFINQKVKSGLAAGLNVILCIGENIEQRETGKTKSILKKQLTKGLEDVTSCKNLMVAYEPIWAISGGDPNKPKPIATRQQIEEVHGFIKDLLAKKFESAFIPVLYGGSANDKNAAEIFSCSGVDGALVGGASLVPEKFAAMVNLK